MLINKNNLKLLFKIVISVLFIVFLFENSDVTQTLNYVMKSNPLIWIAGVLLYIFGQVISTYRWKILANGAGFKGSSKNYIYYYFTGMFFNLFLPTTVGGDVIKAYYLSKNDAENRKVAAAYTILADRITGVTVLIWFAALAMFFSVSSTIPFMIKIITISISLGILFIAPVFYSFCNIFKGRRWIDKLLVDISIYWQNPLLITKALTWSVVFHLIIILIHILIAQAIGIKVPVLYYFIIYPMSSLAGFLPVSFNGIGPREATYIYFFSLVGIEPSLALAFGIFWFGIVLISSLTGGIFYLKGKQIGLENEKDKLSAIQ